ncbi:MAG: hypothetical protein P8079_01445, partial [Gammaproteobacteria bacterium]
SSNDGVTWTEQSAAAAFSPRGYHQVRVFNNRLWLLEGINATGYVNDVWSSADGVSWTQETAAAAVSRRAASQLVVYDQRLWLVAGNDNGYKNDVWSSSDGADWRLGYNGTIHFQ